MDDSGGTPAGVTGGREGCEVTLWASGCATYDYVDVGIATRRRVFVGHSALEGNTLTTEDLLFVSQLVVIESV